MRKHLLTVFIIFLATLSYGQSSTLRKTEQEVKTMLCHKWLLTHMEAKGQRLPVPAEISDSYMILHPDGSFVESGGGKTFNGTWTYQHKFSTLTTNDKGVNEKHKIVKISADQLILRSSFEGMAMDRILKRMD